MDKRKILELVLLNGYMQGGLGGEIDFLVIDEAMKMLDELPNK